MILAVDIGNTKTAAGLVEGTDVRARTSAPTDTRPELEAVWAELCRSVDNPPSISGAIVCSVVPKATAGVMEGVRKLAGVEPVEYTVAAPVGITVRYEPPGDVGADRLANAYAAWKLYGLPAIIVDIGTALTIDCINAKAEYLGGVIAPGIGISLDALHGRTALLPQVELRPPPRVLGTSTVTSIQSGITLGHSFMISGLVDALREELAFGPDGRVVITGGYTAILRRQLRRVSNLIDPDLTLKGLALIHQQVGSSR
jgi:type III pantothenate kinase